MKNLIENIDFTNFNEKFYKEIEEWLNKKEASPLIFYKLVYFSFENELPRLFQILEKYEQKFKKKCIANKNNNEYDKLISQSLKKGYVEIFDMLKGMDVLNNKDINIYLEMALISKKEELLVEIYEEKEKICTKLKINNPLNLIKIFLNRNNYKITKLIYKDYINTDNYKLEEINEIYEIISKKGELHLIKFLYETTPEIFLELYTDIVIEAIQKGFLDIFGYLVEILKIKEIDNEDKLELLEIALYTNNEDIFEIIYDIIKPIDLTRPNLNLIKEAKKINENIFSFLYNEQGKQQF